MGRPVYCTVRCYDLLLCGEIIDRRRVIEVLFSTYRNVTRFHKTIVVAERVPLHLSASKIALYGIILTDSRDLPFCRAAKSSESGDPLLQYSSAVRWHYIQRPKMMMLGKIPLTLFHLALAMASK